MTALRQIPLQCVDDLNQVRDELKSSGWRSATRPTATLTARLRQFASM